MHVGIIGMNIMDFMNKNIQRIGTGGFGKVYRANWKNSDQYLALKSFFNLDDVTAKKYHNIVQTST
uniref:Protein kinase domain-containing protein n=2 Tax=Rhizophagus irregularis (strain DAOM 181602 / DAOM 197198 / MUCL 43194) TaxID=747089 RepID=U9TAN4_RHIID